MKTIKIVNVLLSETDTPFSFTRNPSEWEGPFEDVDEAIECVETGLGCVVEEWWEHDINEKGDLWVRLTSESYDEDWSTIDF